VISPRLFLLARRLRRLRQERWSADIDYCVECVGVYEIFPVLFAVAVGFSLSGVIGSLHQLITSRPASFGALGGGFATGAWAIPVIVFGGPFILMRNALRGRLIEGRPMAWIAATAAIATGWSFASGVVLLEIALGA
jgi:hypothetical protein